MSAPLRRLILWRKRFLRDWDPSDADAHLLKDLRRILGEEPEERLLMAVSALRAGGGAWRLKDPEVRFWAVRGAVETYRAFNGFPHLSGEELAFVFYGLGKLFVPLLMHERGVRSESFKSMSPTEREDAVLEELDTLWETQLPLILRALQLLGLKSMRK